jgi:DivIVA domain-containing protein
MLPEEVANRSFKSALRGISETDVRVFLRRIADDIARTRADEQALRDRVTELEERVRNPLPPTEQQLLDALGEETAKVLRSAQDAADEIRTKAEDRAAAVRREAQDDAKRAREDADETMTARVAEAEAEAARIREHAEAKAAAMIAEAESRVDDVRLDAEREADRIRARAVDVAEAHLEDARTSGREMVTEARTVRERILSDLVTRRTLLSEQIEELRAGRESLLGAYKIVKESLDSATAALRNVEARAATELLGTGPDLATATLGGMGAGGDTEGVLVEPAPVFYDQDATVAVVTDGIVDEGNLDLAAAEFHAVLKSESAAEVELGDLEADVAVDAAVADVVDVVEAPAPVVDVAVEVESAEPEVGVDALFAKLRAAREVAVDDARHVLEATEPVAEPAAGSEAPIGAAPKADAGVATEVTTVVIDLESPEDNRASSGGANTADDALREAQRAAIDAVLAGLARKAKRVLQDEQNEMLDALRTAKRAPKAEDVLPERAARIEAWSGTVASALAGVYAAGWEASGATSALPEVAPNGLVLELVDALITPWRDLLADAIDGDAEGDAVTRVGARFRELRAQLLDPALREALAAGYARGVYDATPEGAVLRWVPAEVGHCPDCDDNALEPVTKGAPFPTGQVFPPAHPGCRCLLGTLTPAVGAAS